MLKGKDLARFFRQAKVLLVKRDEDGLWVSDTYILIKLNPFQANEFFNKWNSYKSTVNIPVLKPGETFKISSTGEKIIDHDPIGNLLENINRADLQEIIVTDFCHLSDGNVYRVYKYDKEIGVFDNEFSPILKGLSPDTVQIKGIREPLVLENEKGRVVGLIMPIRSDLQLKREINELAV